MLVAIWVSCLQCREEFCCWIEGDAPVAASFSDFCSDECAEEARERV